MEALETSIIVDRSGNGALTAAIIAVPPKLAASRTMAAHPAIAFAPGIAR